MKDKVEIIEDDILYLLNGLSTKEAVLLLSKYDKTNCKLDVDRGYYDDDVTLRVIRVETKEEKEARILREKEEKALLKLEKERKLYLELKSKFEGK